MKQMPKKLLVSAGALISLMTAGSTLADSSTMLSDEAKRIKSQLAFKIPKDMQKNPQVNQWAIKAGADSSTMLSDEAKRIESQLAFVIPKDMQKDPQVIQWTIKAGSIGRPVLSGNHYQLVNLAVNRGLTREVRTWAANLGFLPSSSKKFNMLVKRKKGNGQVRYGDVVALNLKPYGWLRYKKQGDYGGINLGDDDHNPHYIWQIRGGKNGTKLVSGMPFALYNTAPQRKEVIYCKRASGIDLGWFPTSKCGGFLSEMSSLAFGPNGALSGDGYAGKLASKMKDYVCETAVGATSAYVTAQTGGTGAAAVAIAAPAAIEQCKRI